MDIIDCRILYINSLHGTISTSIIEYVDEQTPANVLDVENLSSTDFDRAIEFMATRETIISFDMIV